MFGRYRLDDLLGRGGMGEVHRAYDTERDRVVAVKRLSTTLADADDRARFRRESRTAASLDAPHIVRVYDYGEIDGQLYLAMQLIDGTDLRRLLEQGPLPATRTVEVLSAVAQALDAAHAAGVVHRDVKPSNILLDADGTAYLSDFGIAKPMAPDATSLTQTGGEIGTLDYMAPERLMRHGADGRSDVYALACVLFQCLTGKLPFPATDTAGKLAAQLNDPPPTPSLLSHRVPSALDLVVATGMDKDPRRRYPTCGELLAATAAAIDEQPRTATLPTTPNVAGEPGSDPIMRAIVAVAERQQHPGPMTEDTVAVEAPTVATGDGCPYPGLRAFDTVDAEAFYGREHALTDVLVRLSRQSAQSGPLLLVGASGTGKSSLMRAGVLPALADAAWPQIVLTPGPTPLTSLAARMAPLANANPADLAARLHAQPTEFGALCRQIGHQRGGTRGRLVLAVDQLEELFTAGVDEHEAHAFVTALTSAWPALVLATMRADFVEHGIRMPHLRSALAAPYLLGPLSVTDLERVITEPARAAGVAVEDGLVERLITDIGARDAGGYDPGALPRLAHALRETWHQRDGDLLTLQAYQRTGGVDRAVALTADGVYHQLPESQRQRLRSGLLRMVTVLDTGGVARRRAARTELPEHVLQVLVDARLVTADSSGAQLSHESLLTAWPRLRQWVDEDRHGLVVRQRLDDAATAWQAAGRDAAELYRGGRLVAAEDWAADRDDLTELESAFLTESRRAQRRASRRMTGLVSALSVFLVLALVAGLLAVLARNDAVEEGHVAESRQLAAESLAEAEFDPAAADRKALQAWQASQTPQARGALLSAATTNALPETLPTDATPNFGSGDLSPDGSLFTFGSPGGGVTVVDLETGETWNAPAAHTANVAEAEFSPDGSLLATVSTEANGLHIWDVQTRQHVRELPGTTGLAWLDDDSVASIAARGSGTSVGAWHPRTGERDAWLTTPLDDPSRSTNRIDISPDGSRLAIGNSDATVELWDTDDKELLARAEHSKSETASGEGDGVNVVIDDDTMVSATLGSPAIRVFDAESGDSVRTIENPNFSPGSVQIPAFVLTADGGHLIMQDRSVSGAVVWNLETGQRAGEFAMGPVPTTQSGIMTLDTSPDGQLVGARIDGSIVRWPTNPRWYRNPTSRVGGVTFGADGEQITAFERTAIHTWSPTSGRPHRDPTGVGNGARIWAVTDGHNGTRYVGTADGELTEVDSDGRTTRTVSLPVPGELNGGTLTVSPDGTHLAVLTDRPTDEPGGWKAEVHVLETETLRRVGSADVGSVSATSPAFSPDSATLVMATTRASNGNPDEDDTHELRRWRVPDMQEKDPWSVDGGGRTAFTPDGASIVLAAEDHVEIVDAATGEKRRSFGQHPSEIGALAVSPDGSTVATGTVGDPTVRLWDVAEGRQLATLTGHQDAVNDLKFSPDGATLASASSDTDVALWTVDTAAAEQQLCTDLEAASEKELGELGCDD